MARLDHLAVCAADLADGTEATQAALGVALVPGGVHTAMGTHNRLLGLGDVYLEVIAPDPVAPPPAHPRWFALDGFSGPPRLGAWVVAVDDLDAALAAAPAGAGRPMALSRGDLAWRMAVPEDGRLPFDGCFPALIEWSGTARPPARLPESGCRLRRLTLHHPRTADLAAALPAIDDPRLVLAAGPPGLSAEIETPRGAVRLCAPA